MTQEITVKKSTYNTILVGVFVLAVAFSFTTGFIVGGGTTAAPEQVQQVVQQPQQQPQQEVPEPQGRVQVSLDDDPVTGSSSAPVTVIEFSDYQCPFCQRWHQQSWESLKTNYIDTGKVKFVYRDFPLSFHQNAEISAEAANCAGEQNKYWEMHSTLFAKGSGDGTGLDSASLKKYAADLGIDATKFAQCLDSSKYQSEIEKDTNEGADAGVSGTPSFFIGSPSKGYQLIVGAQPYSVFEQAIEQELAG